MKRRKVPESWLEDKPDIPPPRVEDKFERWNKTYSVTRLEELTISDIDSAEIEFQNKVERLKTEYRPGRLINPAMAQIAGKEPFTQEEFRQVRCHISDEAEQIRMNFKQARGRCKQKRKQHRENFWADTAGRVADSFTNINISFELPKLK